MNSVQSNPVFWGLMLALVMLGIGLLLIAVGLSRKRGDLRGEPTRSVPQRETEMMAPTGEAAMTSLPSRDEGTWPSPGYRSARTRARWAQVLVGMVAGIYVIAAISGIYDLSLLARILNGSATQSEVDSYLQFADSLTSLSVLMMLASGIAVVAWLSRTVEIVPPLGGGTPRRSPREAIGWWFVPIAFLFIPYQIVRDVYGRLETSTRHGGDGSVLAWWLLFIIGVTVSRAVGTAIPRATTIDAARSLQMIVVVVNLAIAAGGFLLVRIVGEIEARATERAVSLHLRGPDAVWPTPSGVPTPSVTDPRTSTAAPVQPTGIDTNPASPPVAEDPSSNIEARLATLERLRATGAISEDEFATRRSKILDEI